MPNSYKSFKHIPFKDEIPEWMYKRIYRSRDPPREIKRLERQVGRELVDRKESKKRLRELERLLMLCFLFCIPLVLSQMGLLVTIMTYL